MPLATDFTVEDVRTILREKKWPIVGTIFLYPTRSLAPTSLEEITHLKSILAQHGLHNTIALIDSVTDYEWAFQKKLQGLAVMLAPRDIESDSDLTPEQQLRLWQQKDIILGSRDLPGESVMEWIHLLTEQMAAPGVPIEIFQLLDAIFEDVAKAVQRAIAQQRGKGH